VLVKMRATDDDVSDLAASRDQFVVEFVEAFDSAA